MRVLVVEDDVALNAGLKFDLEAEGYEVSGVYQAKEALEMIKKEDVGLVILDVNLPDENGFSLCRKIRDQKQVPVIFLTACDLEADQMAGFDEGADDYITKPFSMPVLRKRVKAVLRRYEKEKEHVYDDGFLVIDFQKMAARQNGESLPLTKTEYRLLKVLAANAGNVMTRELLLAKLWDNEGNFVDEHALTVNINRLRNKLEDSTHKYIKTVYGMGYVWAGERFE
ncbi:MAG: response regulator transcription factor [Lachnospiraceae bacterium]|nr:response regulator transcription factor [Lachnospiraceae bacterium]